MVFFFRLFSQCPQAGGQHPVVRRAPGLPEAHRLLLKSPFGGGRPGRVKRKNLKKNQGGGGGAAEEEED